MPVEVHAAGPIELCSHCGHSFQTQSLQSAATPSRLREYHASVGEEKEATQAIIAAAEAELQRCEAEISRLERLLHVMNHEKRRIGTIIEENRSLLSPIRRMPAELLSTVFELCLPGFAATISSLFDKLDYPILCTPLQIAASCHFWRELAMSTPSLWSRIVLNTRSAIITETAADVLDTFLHRSGEHGLHLFLKTTSRVPNSRIILSLAANFSRVSHMKVLGTFDPFKDASTSHLSFPQLTTFGFVRDYSSRESNPFSWFPWLASATQLRSVVLDNTTRLPEFTAPMRNENVSFLAIRDRFVSQTFGILRSFPNLIEGWIGAGKLYHGRNDGYNHMEFPKMQSLTIYQLGYGSEYPNSVLDIGPYLRSLTLPSLSMLRFANSSSYPTLSWSLSDFAPFVSRSGIGNKITVFDLRGSVGSSAHQMIETLELLPAITDLVLLDSLTPASGILASVPLLIRLMVNNNHRPLLPALAKLKVRFCTDDATDGTVERLSLLVSLVKSRCPGIVPQTVSYLQHLWFKLISPTGEESIDDLVECRLLGVRVHAEIVKNDERDQWLQSSGERRDWYDFD